LGAVNGRIGARLRPRPLHGPVFLPCTAMMLIGAAVVDHLTRSRGVARAVDLSCAEQTWTSQPHNYM